VQDEIDPLVGRGEANRPQGDFRIINIYILADRNAEQIDGFLTMDQSNHKDAAFILNGFNRLYSFFLHRCGTCPMKYDQFIKLRNKKQ